MRYELFTDKSIAQCMSALNERMEQKGTSSRPALNGWIEKKQGKFALAMSTPILGLFKRTTRIEGQAARESGITVIRGYVPDGAPLSVRLVVLFGLWIVGAALLLAGQIFLMIIAILGGIFVYFLLKSDYENGDRLLLEIERALKANPTPPKELKEKFGYR